ncbi:winged helix-turn-helix domain-containing protein [Haloarculaceae archaeon H-GB2-1]|nr:winged helix-turn-helix domain-containing protein [Haloarculaceae archaeon H-GB1-1]MEA5385967.1 winged helix-turn-helix domain-containing protein [Haloarculaceae archaeon H-GB11]MEA5407472.1 winged helix-turn-helix domain-containing protein [Haloarculaceae archaeon H-GB2-1]
MSDASELDAVVDLLDDEYARAILRATSVQALSAEELSEQCDMSPPTVYRRLDRLREHDLVAAQQQLDPDGHHYEVYTACLSRVTIDLDDGDFDLDVERTDQDAADRFTDLFETLQ